MSSLSERLPIPSSLSLSLFYFAKGRHFHVSVLHLALSQDRQTAARPEQVKRVRIGSALGVS